ncbi:hypothetical protein OC835_002234 [Tilletia horrida]|uniref:Uncharacterized protein n=1 Tax=Tilletia horrida TaxID=155126 RepID=A0AAN6GC94_9BASI|nr:hypothetical protein OC842_004132 [Tilletia horrida]KAK0535891.1 hypothetical protein OC835_002234 [Tilletia horrida]
MPPKRSRFFPQPFRVDGRRNSSVASTSSGNDEQQQQQQQQRRRDQSGPSSSSSSVSGPPLFSSELPPPSMHERFNKDGTENVEWARYQSTLRLKAKWDSIYERYKDAHLEDQDEIELAPRVREGSKGKSMQGKKRKATAGRKRKRVPFGQLDSDVDSFSDSADEFDSSDPSSDSGGPSNRSSSGIRVVRDCGVLRNLAGTLHFGSFIKDEELDALEAVLDDDEAANASASASTAKTGQKGTSDTAAGSDQDEDTRSEVEFSSDDDDEIGGWGEKAFLQPQYPEFDPRTQLAASEREDNIHGRDDAATAAARKYDPDLEEFLLAEERRRRLRAMNTSHDDDEDDDSDVFDFTAETDETPNHDAGASSSSLSPAATATAAPGQQIMAEVEEYYSSDDGLDMLGTPKRRKHGQAGRPRAKAAAAVPAPATSSVRSRAPVSHPGSAAKRPAAPTRTDFVRASGAAGKADANSLKPAFIIPSFEEAQRAKRSGVEAILLRWTREQEAYLAQEEEEERYRFDLGFSREVTYGRAPTSAVVVVDVFDSLPESYRGMAGLAEMLAEHS